MPLIADSVRQLSAAMMVAALVIAALVVGEAALVPFAMAVILSFMLSPIVRFLEAKGLPETGAVLGVMAVSLSAITGLAFLFGLETLSLTARLGDYRENVVAKVRSVATYGREDGILKRASDSIDRLTEGVTSEIERTREKKPFAAAEEKPKVVVTSNGGFGPGEILKNLGTYLQPLALAGLTLLFTVFLLAQHHDLRDRVVRVLGTDHLSDTTAAMAEAGERLSRLFLAQAVMNAGYGAVVGCVLWAAGMPSALLWGTIAGLMRFVPFVGVFIAAVPPILLAAGVSSDWTLLIFTLVFFVIGEVLMGNVVEPLALGRQIGLSPFAMVAAASFWTLVWGPIGLLLAAPLTMVLVVVGRYLPGLSFFSILLGDTPALTPAQALYQRLLSGDVVDVAERLEEFSDEAGLVDLSDDLVLPALRLAASDAECGRLSVERVGALRETLDEAVEAAGSMADGQADGATDSASRDSAARVLVVAARGAIDIAASRFVADIIERKSGRKAVAYNHASGLTAFSAARHDDHPPFAVVIVSVGGVLPAHLPFIVRRACQQFPDARVVALTDMPQQPSGRAETSTAKHVDSTARLLELLQHDNKSEKTITETAA